MSFGMIMLKSKFGEKGNLCYMDRDSLLYKTLMLKQGLILQIQN